MVTIVKDSISFYYYILITWQVGFYETNENFFETTVFVVIKLADFLQYSFKMIVRKAQR